MEVRVWIAPSTTRATEKLELLPSRSLWEVFFLGHGRMLTSWLANIHIFTCLFRAIL